LAAASPPGSCQRCGGRRGLASPRRSGWEPAPPSARHRRARRPCHQRAIHSGPRRSQADNHGQHPSALDLRRSLASQVTTAPDLALQAGVVGSSPIISTAPQRGNGVVHRRQNVTCTAYVHPLRVRIEHPEPPMLSRQERTRKAVPTTRADVRSVPATAVTTGWTERRGACCAVPSLARENRASEGDQLWTVTRRSPSMD
jgi:hypothetical protein